VQHGFLSLLPSAVKAAASQQQSKAAGSLPWLIKAAGPQALSREALAAALVTIPDVPAAVAAQLLAAGLPVTEHQLVAASKAKVSGLDVWLQHEPCLELSEGVMKLRSVSSPFQVRAEVFEGAFCPTHCSNLLLSVDPSRAVGQVKEIQQPLILCFPPDQHNRGGLVRLPSHKRWLPEILLSRIVKSIEQLVYFFPAVVDEMLASSSANLSVPAGFSCQPSCPAGPLLL